MQNEAIANDAQRKKVIGKLSLLFLMAMIGLTFFSNTINNFTLPRVQTARPTNGALIKEIFGEGTVEVKSTREEYADANLRVKEVMVEQGDMVSKGQPIISLDVDGLKSDYQDEQARYRQLQLSLAGAREEQAQKQRDYDNLKYLFDNEAETAVNLQNAEKNLGDAKRNCENIQLNLEIQARKVYTLARQVANNGVYTAPVGGMITELNFAEGSMTNNSLPLFKLADLRQGFRLIVPIDNDLVDYVKPGDTVSVNILSLGDKKTEGKIDKIVENSQHNGEEKDLWIDVSLEGLTGGEKEEIYLSKKTKPYATLVPNSAVYNDSSGSYILVLKSRKGPLGTENYLQKVEVNVEDSDNEKSALTDMVMDEMVTQSNKPVEDGDRVLKEAAN
ncbi:MAG: macrolide transporter subunit MacA [Pelotomaculum sp. PtaB.Bin013]|uniref:Efflux RND transporter periplasmic adaptor subunit n=1 Tax=Pelotomaculum isophthalicicum JI TaxID=947010 RepID=A0A9X4JVJ4_9FIRM|nr:efflux RND transporter periplasmic adaptor subunit [Pelotomaculum isophthalicicum]MDF9408441.1 efflux RND transporter periplasmic adaptor subunit [Pelotomaculum isophthalicicum JI]OPX89810.1 MAG: macrolide transporter subunit MacA [Pelotomaculum sp. PtaB.Bin013]